MKMAIAAILLLFAIRAKAEIYGQNLVGNPIAKNDCIQRASDINAK
tara:strand:- start:562 stop:699 length:138 start_codon:yes stop_codon:yes gene_type:complete